MVIHGMTRGAIHLCAYLNAFSFLTMAIDAPLMLLILQIIIHSRIIRITIQNVYSHSRNVCSESFASITPKIRKRRLPRSAAPCCLGNMAKY